MDLDALAALRMRLLSRHRAYHPSSEALAFHRGQLDKAQAKGEVLALPGRALLAHWFDPAPSTSLATRFLIVHRVPDDESALRWCRERLDELLPAFGDQVEWHAPAWEIELMRHAETHAVRRANLQLVGRVSTGLRRLVELRDPPRRVEGLELRELVPDDVDAVMELRRAAFAAEPRYCHFGALPAVLEAQRAALLADDRPADRLVVCRGGQVLGYMGAEYRQSPHRQGRGGGLDLVLGPELRGRGLLKTGYRLLLERMGDRGITWFEGATGQRPVMHLSGLMWRRPIGQILRRQAWFPEGWFDDYQSTWDDPLGD